MSVNKLVYSEIETSINTIDQLTDQITKALNTMNELREYIYTKKPGDEIVLNISRGKISKEIKIVLGK